MVDSVFHRVAERYDLMNDLMSGGLHRLWKDAMVAWLNPPKRPRLEAARRCRRHRRHRLSHHRGVRRQCPGDRARHQRLDAGRRARAGRTSAALRPVRSSSRPMPRSCRSRTSSFDAYTIAFGIRNVPHIDKALSEAFRVLKPGGRFLCLEFSEVDHADARPRLRDLVLQRHSADRRGWSPATANPTAIWSNRSASFPTSTTSPR